MGLRCCARAFSNCRKWGLLFVAVCAAFSLRWLRLLQSMGSRRAGSAVVARGLRSTGSVVVAHGLSCSAGCGMFLDQGLNPCPLHWQADSQPLCHQGSRISFHFYYLFSSSLFYAVDILQIPLLGLHPPHRCLKCWLTTHSCP